MTATVPFVADPIARRSLRAAAAAQAAWETADAVRAAAVSDALDNGCSIHETAQAMGLLDSDVHRLRRTALR